METTNNTVDLTHTQEDIKKVCASIYTTLIEKNRRYGNSAIQPAGVFSKVSAEQAILVRLDDKLKRVQNSEELRKNDIFDLIGYLTLLAVSKDWTFEDMVD